MKSILKKHHLLNDVEYKGDESIMVVQKSSKVVQRLISILHLLDNLIFLMIVDCESADFSDVDICDMPKLTYVNLSGTEHNFEEQGYECFESDHTGVLFYNSSN
jgi:hypothetical protein